MRLKSFLRYFARTWQRVKPFTKKRTDSRRLGLLLEMLERRDLLATAPTILSAGVLPVDGSTVSTGTPVIRVAYSETMTSSVLTPSNYVLLGSGGNPVPIDSVVFDPGAAIFDSAVLITYNGGAPANPNAQLVVDSYTLFVKGDHVFDVNDGLAVAQPGQLVVGNSAQNNVAVVNIPGNGTLGAISDYDLAGSGLPADPGEVAFGDLDGDGIQDLVVVNNGSSQAMVYLGRTAASGGAFATTPSLTLNLPATGAVGLPRQIAMGDFNHDGKTDLAITTSFNTAATVDSVSVFLNTTTSIGALSFGSPSSISLDSGAPATPLAPVGIVAADFDGDGNTDLAVLLNNPVSSIDGDLVNDYRVAILANNGSGTFTLSTLVKVGDAAGWGAAGTSLSLASADVTGNSLSDLIIGVNGGTRNGVYVFTNTSTTGAFSFTPLGTTANIASVVSPGDGTTRTHVKLTGIGPVPFSVGDVIEITGGAAAGTYTIAAIPSATPGFDFDLAGPSSVPINAAGGTAILAKPISVAGGAGVVSIATGHVDSDATNDIIVQTATNKLDVIRNLGGGVFVDNTVASNVTAPALTGGGDIAVGNLDNNGRDDIAVTSNTAPGTLSVLRNDSGIQTKVGTIATITGSGLSPVVVTTTAANTLATGEQVFLSGTGVAAFNGVFTITRVSATSFTLNGTNLLTGTASTGSWSQRAISSAVGVGGILTFTTTTPHGLATGDMVVVRGVGGYSAADGAFSVTVTSPTTFTVAATAGSSSGAIASVSRVSNNVTVTSATPQGWQTGDILTISGVAGLAGINGQYSITVISPTAFTFANVGADGVSTPNTGNWDGSSAAAFDTGAGGVISSVTRTAPGPGQTTTVTVIGSLTLNTGDYVTIAGVQGLAGINGTYVITVVGASQFTINTSGVAGTSVVGQGTYDNGLSFSVNNYNNVGSGPTGVAISTTSPASPADTNQDGLADIVVANSADDSFTLLPGNGDGTVQTGVNYTMTPTVTNEVAVADLNQDGIPDIVSIASSPIASKISIRQGVAGGTYLPEVVLTVSTTFDRSLTSVAIADINGDGRPDIILLSAADDAVTFLTNNLTPGAVIGAGSFTSLAPAGDIFTDVNPTQVVAGDFNDDGVTDLAIPFTGGGGGVDIFLGTATAGVANAGFAFDGTLFFNTPMQSVVLGDFNNDGELDLVAAESGTGAVDVALGDGLGGFSSGGAFATSVPNIGSMVATDLNDDGFLDLVVASQATSITNAGIAVLFNQFGTRFATPIQTDVVPGTGLNSIVATDVNQDGFPDILVSTNVSPSTGTIVAAVNNGSGLFRVTSFGHGLTTGDQVFITGSNIPTMNGFWTITVISPSQFDLNGSTFAAGFTGTATWNTFASPTLDDNVYLLVSNGGSGTFQGAIPYQVGATPAQSAAPSYLATTPSPLIRLTTFTSGGTIVAPNLVANGDFEDRDLSGEVGNILGWQQFALQSTGIAGSHGTFLPQSGTNSPLSVVTVPAPSGTYQAMLDESDIAPITNGFNGPGNPNLPSDYEGTHTLYQNITLPANATSISLSLSMYIDNSGSLVGFTDPTAVTPPFSLDYNPADGANQQVRVDIMRSSADPLSVSTAPPNLQYGAIASIVGAGGTSDVVVTTNGNNGLKTGDIVTISGLTTFAAANGTFTITVIDATHFSLNGNKTVGTSIPNNGTMTAAGIGSIASVVGAGSGASIVVTTNGNHGLTTGARVTLAGLATFPAANGTWTITVIDATHFSLTGVGSTAIGASAANTGTWAVPGTGGIASIVGTGGNIIVTTTNNHGLSTGAFVNIAGVTGFAAANGLFKITVIDATHFSLNGTGATGSSSIGGATWSVPGDVLLNVFQSNTLTPTILSQVLSANLSAFAGQSIVVRIATVNNEGKLIVGVDNVKINARYADSQPPTITGLSISNPSYVDALGLAHTNDPTIIGRVSDGGGLITSIVRTAVAGQNTTVTTSLPHGLATGARVTIADVQGLSGVNGTFVIVVTSPTTFTISSIGGAGTSSLGTGDYNDGGNVNNIAYIEIDTSNSAFTNPATIIKVTQWDANGNFSIKLPTTTPGLTTIQVRAVDKAGNVSSSLATGSIVSATESGGVDPIVITTATNHGLATGAFVNISGIDGYAGANGLFQITVISATQFSLNGTQIAGTATPNTGTWSSVSTFSFYMLGGSATEWEPVGPQNIDVTSQGVDFTKVSGRVTAVLADSSDPTGNTYFVGTVNGGVWETTNGGSTWFASMNSLTNSSGVPITSPISNIAQSSRQLIDPLNPTLGFQTNQDVLYAATGVVDIEADSRPGVGILKSVDHGKTWTLIGNSGTVLGGARISKIVVDADDPNTAYAAVASGGSSGPGVYKTTDGGLTWANVLDPTQMTINGVVVGAGTALASVTDMVIDPLDSNRLLIGLGNISLVPDSTTAGVWLSPNKGSTWTALVGGQSPAPPITPIPNSTAPSGINVGRVTVAIASTRVGNESIIYAMFATKPTITAPAVLDGKFTGLYKTKDNGLNFTKVMLRENVPTPTQPYHFIDINVFGNDASNSGALAVDPTNPNVVYVGGSNNWEAGGDPPNHGFIRVDTGNMRDTTYFDPVTNNIPNDGDDIDKKLYAENRGGNLKNFYFNPNDPYVGEGVYWQDLDSNTSGITGTLDLLPNAITSLTFDAQGRLLIGTDAGISRGTQHGFGYDITSGNFGMVLLVDPTYPPFNAVGMTFTSLNGNLSIANLTSVAIDPLNPGVYYTTQFDTGTASFGGPLGWISDGLEGPNGAPIPNAGQVIAIPPPFGSPAGTPTTFIRNWQYAYNGLSLALEISTDNGATWQAVITAGINVNDNAYVFPALAFDPTQQFLSGVYRNALAFGTDRIYLGRTGGTTWDQISPVLSAGAKVTAISFAPSTVGTMYAATSDGKIFYTTNPGQPPGNWLQRNTGTLPAVNTPGVFVDNISVDPLDPLTAFITYAGAGNFAHVYVTHNGGATWAAASNGLPNVPAYSFVIDRNPSLGALLGKLYVGTEVGAYLSIDGGANWIRVGQGQSMPNVPVVDLQIDANRVNPDGTTTQGLNVLTAATLGRGVYSISTAAFPSIPDQVTTENSPTAVIPLTINDPSGTAVYTLSATSDRQSLIPPANIIFGGTGLNRTIQVIPGADMNDLNGGGPAHITVTLTSGTAGTSSFFTFSATFTVSVTPVNQLPTITPIGTQTILSNTVDNLFNFTVNDAETPGGSIVVTATSADQALIPNSNMTISSGVGGARTLHITPVAGQTGSTRITITVDDTTGGIITYVFDILVSENVTLSPTPFTDDFNRPDNNLFLGAGWVVNQGDFDVVSNQAVAMNNTMNIATLNALSTSDAVLEADVNLPAGNVSYAGFVARYAATGASNYYWATLINVNGVVFAQIYKNVNGVFQPALWSQVVNYTPGTSGHLRLEVIGDSLKLFLNDSLVGYVNDTQLSAPGTFGILASQGGKIDNFSATALAGTPVTVPFTDTFDANPPRNQLSTDWRTVYGDMSITGAGAAAAATGVGATNLSTVYVSTPQTDGFVQANATLSPTATTYVGLVARYSGDVVNHAGFANFYTALFVHAAGGGTFVQLYSNINGVFHLLSNTPVAFTSALLRLEVVADSLRVYANGTLVGYASDPNLTSGTYGIWTTPGATTDNFNFDAINVTPGTLPYQDDFGSLADGDLLPLPWIEHSGNFTALGQAATAQAAGVNIAGIDGISAADVFSQADVTLDSTNGALAGVIARANFNPGNSSYYLGAVYQFNGVSYAMILKFVNGAASVIGINTVSSTTGTLRLEVVGDSLTLLLNGAIVTWGNDAAPLSAGSVGIWATTGSTLDNFNADAITLNTTNVPFSEDFNAYADGAPLGLNWINHAGMQFANAGAMVSQSALNIATLSTLNQGDVSVQADITLDTVAASALSGVIARYNNTAGGPNYYTAVLVRAGAAYTLDIFRVFHGTFALLASVNVTSAYVPGVTLRLDVAGDSLKAFLNGVLETYANDPFLTSAAGGSAGLFSTQNNTVDNFSVADDSLTPVTIPPAFTDDFNSPDNTQLNSNWLNRIGNFSTLSNAINSTAAFSIATLNGVSLGDTSINLNGVTLGAALNSLTGAVARYNGSGVGNFYWGGLIRTTSGIFAYIIRFQNGGATVVASGLVSSATGNLQFNIVGNTLQLLFDSGSGYQLVASGSDAAPLPAGTGGIMATQGGGADQFQMQDLTAVTANIPPAFSDPFGIATGNTIDITQWNTSLGGFVGTGSSVAGLGAANIAMLRQTPIGDTTVQAQLTAASGGMVGMFARASAAPFVNSYFAALYNTGSITYVLLLKYVNGVQITLGAQVVGSSSGLLTLDIIGDTLRVYLNGTPVLTAFDSTFATGSVGLFATPGNSLDSFSVDTVDPPTLPISDSFNGTALGSDPSVVNWAVRMGSFTVSSNMATGATANVPNFATVIGLSSADVDISATASLATNQVVGLSARYTPGPGFGNEYLAELSFNGTSYVAQIYLVTNGHMVLLKSQNVASFAGQIRFQVTGSSLTLSLDSVAVISITDTTITGPGSVGMTSSGGASLSAFQVN